MRRLRHVRRQMLVYKSTLSLFIISVPNVHKMVPTQVAIPEKGVFKKKLYFVF